MPTPAPVLPIGADAGVDASSGSGSDEKDDMSVGTVVGVVLGVLLALALLGAVVMWVRGAQTPSVNNGGLNRAVPMYSNPAYVAGTDRAAMGRHDSSV